jgi:hypothetical protein
MAVDQSTLLRNAIEWAISDEQPVTVSGPGILDVTCWRQENSVTVHMVNLTDPMMLRSSLRETPAGWRTAGQRASAQGKNARAVRLLVDGRTL